MQVKDTMIIYMLDFIDDLGNEIVFTEYAERKWGTSSMIKTKYPSTYKSLCYKLAELFVDHKFEFDCDSKKEIV